MNGHTFPIEYSFASLLGNGITGAVFSFSDITERKRSEREIQNLALMFLALDNFKMLYDTLGHAAGDGFLRVIARRLREGSRQADTVARLGGDEFVWFGEIIDEEDAKLIAEKFLDAIAQPVKLGEHTFSSTISIGIAIFPDSTQDVTGLMKCADAAMYSVKQKNKNGFQFYR